MDSKSLLPRLDQVRARLGLDNVRLDPTLISVKPDVTPRIVVRYYSNPVRAGSEPRLEVNKKGRARLSLILKSLKKLFSGSKAKVFI